MFGALAEGLAARGHRVTRVHAERQPEREGTDLGERWALPLPEFQTWRKLPHPASAVASARAALRLAQCLRWVRPDVVNVHFVDSRAAYFLLLRLLFGYRLVLTAHGSDVLRPRGAVNGALLPHLLRRADAVVAVSADVAGRVRSLAPAAPVGVIQNGVDLGFWTDGGGGEREPGRVVQVGTLRHVKGQDVALRALVLLRADLPHVRLELVGDGPWREHLDALAAELGVRDAVTFAGALGPAQIRERLHRASVCVLPSRSEGLPLTLLEAMAAGAPVVASAVGGVPEVAGEPPCVRLVPPDRPEALAEALRSLLAEPEEAGRLAARARTRVEAFSWSRTLRETEAALDRARAGAPAFPAERTATAEGAPGPPGRAPLRRRARREGAA